MYIWIVWFPPCFLLPHQVKASHKLLYNPHIDRLETWPVCGCVWDGKYREPIMDLRFDCPAASKVLWIFLKPQISPSLSWFPMVPLMVWTLACLAHWVVVPDLKGPANQSTLVANRRWGRGLEAGSKWGLPICHTDKLAQPWCLTAWDVENVSLYTTNWEPRYIILILCRDSRGRRIQSFPKTWHKRQWASASWWRNSNQSTNN